MPRWTLHDLKEHERRVADRAARLRPAVPEPDATVNLQELYADLDSVHRVAKILGVSGETVRRRLMKQGIQLKRRNWTDADVATLKEYYANNRTSESFSLNVIGEMLNRPPIAVSLKANELGISNRRDERRPVTRLTKEKMSQSRREYFASLNPEERYEMISNRIKKAIQEHGHARGMLGKHHTQETKQRISECNKGKVIPPEQTMRSMKTRFAKYGCFGPRIGRGTWKAGWREIGGKRIFARSRWEANYGRYLEWLKQHQEISDWEHEPKTFWFEQIKRGSRSYLPDYRVVYSDGREEFHEVKGWMDSRSRTKLKRMRKYYPEISLVVKDGAWFKANNLKLSAIIPGWEIGTREPKS